MRLGLERVAGESRDFAAPIHDFLHSIFKGMCVLLRRSILLYIACWQAISCPVQSVCICCTIDWSICQYNLSSLASGREVFEPRKLFSFSLLALLFFIFYFFFGLAQLDPFFSPKNVDWIFYHFFSTLFSLPSHLPRPWCGTSFAPFLLLILPWLFSTFRLREGLDCSVLPFLDLSFVDSIQLFSLSSSRLPHLDI